MILNLPIEAAEGYKSPSQRTRVITETWTQQYVLSRVCVEQFNTYQRRHRSRRFSLARCDSAFQLKAKSGSIGRKVVDAAYEAMMRAVLQNRLPHFLFLSYNNFTVSDLLLIPNFCMPPSAIEARKPLRPTARRAGWVGCNILLDLVPPEGRIPVIQSGGIVPKSLVRRNFRTVQPLADMSVTKRGWTLDTLTVLRSLNKREFTLDDAYSFENVLSKMHPDNKHVRDKIRQQLQVLRDSGLPPVCNPRPLSLGQKPANRVDLL